MKIGSIEILGYIGAITWAAVNFLRGSHASDHAVYLFLLGILPNLGAAWALTMFGKWGILLVLKRKYTVRTHGMLCLLIVFFAVISEFIHDWFLSSRFDIYDVLITVAAQLIMFFFPLLLKDKVFGAD